MTVLAWDQTGERTFQTGIDRGVLYLHDGTAVVWNGLTGVDEDSSSELKSFHLDGVKYLENLIPGDFSGKLKAFTYPEEFDSVNGMAVASPGLTFHDQQAKSFNLSYRTLIGDDVEGTEHGYKIHILYNIFANPDSSSFETFNESIQAIEFGWSLSGTPAKAPNYRPTSHLSIDSTKTPPDVLTRLEEKLYGTDFSDPTLPSVQEVLEYFGVGYLGNLVIIDHGDGTWSAVDASDTRITMIDPTEFQIIEADAFYLNLDTYQIFSSDEA